MKRRGILWQKGLFCFYDIGEQLINIVSLYRKSLVVVGAVVALVGLGSGSANAAQRTPCSGLQGIRLPVDKPVELKRVQVRIIRCAKHVQKVEFGNRDDVQCVAFAYALMEKLAPPLPKYSSGGDTAGLYFLRLKAAAKITKPLDGGRPKNQRKPSLIWWSQNMTLGHVGVYIGGDLYIDSQAAELVAKKNLPMTNPKLVAWNLGKSRSQVAFRDFIRRPWPRGTPQTPDGYSLAKVNGGSCLQCK